jgi:hypothetical protein
VVVLSVEEHGLDELLRDVVVPEGEDIGLAVEELSDEVVLEVEELELELVL